MRCHCSFWLGLLVFLLQGCCISPVSHADSAPDVRSSAAGECVVVLHGLGRTFRSMSVMADVLEKEGYLVANIDYPSRQRLIEELAPVAMGEGIGACLEGGADTIHFVTHSMGGILVRYYLEHNDLEQLGRVVMLSPPNQGSEVVDALEENILFRWYFGKAALQLGTEPESLVMRLSAPAYPVGVITGTEHAFFDGWFSRLIPGEDDGKVSVERAQTEGMTDFIALPSSHPFIMDKEEVVRQVIHFLREGKFAR